MNVRSIPVSMVAFVQIESIPSLARVLLASLVPDVKQTLMTASAHLAKMVASVTIPLADTLANVLLALQGHAVKRTSTTVNLLLVTVAIVLTGRIRSLVHVTQATPGTSVRTRLTNAPATLANMEALVKI